MITIPLGVDLAATFLMALTGAAKGVARGYDVVGVAALSMAAGAGGSLLRDGLFLQDGPPAFLQNPLYLAVIALSAVVGVLLRERFNPDGKAYLVIDALAIGLYAVYGSEKALSFGLNAADSALVGALNACGGGMLRDLLSLEQPLIFKPGELQALALGLGCGLHVGLLELGAPSSAAAVASVGLIFCLRMLSIFCGWRTRPANESGMWITWKR